MKKILLLLFILVIAGAAIFYISQSSPTTLTLNEQEKDGYDGPLERGLLEILKTQDPALGRVPTERLWDAIVETEEIKDEAHSKRFSSLIWEERGPIYDSVGVSNGNGRGVPGGQPQPPFTFTSGRIRALLVDTTDPTGNTVWSAGVAGGLWKTTSFLNPVPNWQNANDYFANMAVTSIAQDPSNSDIMYFCTGEATSNADAVQGKGVWKSIDHGLTWNQLPSSVGYARNFKILCDKNGNVYLATRSFGLVRSTDGGANWTTITPSDLTGVTNSSFCTDIEFAGTRLLASFGYTTGSGGVSAVRYTDEPATISSSNWLTPTGSLPGTANRIELAARGDTVYAAPTNGTNNVVVTYKSFDGGASWVQNNLTNYSATAITNGQGWYNLALEISPVNGLEFMVGGLDAYRSIDGGISVVRNTFWVSNPPYVHADHHTYKWMAIGGQLRLIMATDGGLFLSVDNGVSYQDRNIGFGIKQFYSGAIHPLRTDYLLAGSQDNGSHQIKNPGKTYSVEVTGGDGAFVDIDQLNPNFQYTTYVYNQYRRSANDGNNWSSFNLSSVRGYFINPFDYDDSLKVLYGSFANTSAPNKSLLRWNNPTTAPSTTNASRDTLVVNLLMKGASASNVSAVMNSRHTHDRIFLGGHNGSLVRIDSASTVTNANIDSRTTVLTGPSFPSGFINCVAIGSSDNQLLAVFSNYGVTNLWYSADGGTTWTGIDGNLPDMPVRWAIFHPTDPAKVLIATETGVWATDMINGASTEWIPSGNFPNVRTDMLKVRPSDNLVLAATHGRGLWTTNITSVLPITNITLTGALQQDGNSLLLWKTIGITAATKFSIEYSTDGFSFKEAGSVAGAISSFRHQLTAPVGYYRIKGTEPNHPPVYSNIISIRRGAGNVKGLYVNVFPNPVYSNATFEIRSESGGNYNWMMIDVQGRVVQTGKGNISAGVSTKVPLNTSRLSPGMYRLRVVQSDQSVTHNFLKQ